jgi:hypothetical protein
MWLQSAGGAHARNSRPYFNIGTDSLILSKFGMENVPLEATQNISQNQ